MQHKIILLYIQLLLILSIFQAYFRSAQASPIIGDFRSVQINEFPYVVCLSAYVPGRSMSDSIFCSGTLIATYHVLTAEQCFENIGNDPIQIILSTGDLTHGTHTFPLWWISYDMWAHHSRSQITTIYNNIAIIKIFGVTPSLRIAPLSTISPLRLLEGFRAELCGCSVRNANGNSIMMQKAEVRILKKETCAHIVSELEGVELVFPDNYICTNANPIVHLENNDKGGPVLFFDSLIAINVGTFPCMEGAYNVNKVNGHITVDHYRVFIYDMLNY